MRAGSGTAGGLDHAGSGIAMTNMMMDYVGHPIGVARHVTEADRPYRGKRVLDLAMLAVVAIPGLLVGVICALAVRVSSRGPVFFRQERIGMDGQPFKVWKFRTMAHGNNPLLPQDCVITKVGAVLRRFSLDEVPQLLNVITGEMSMVGPRPTLAYQVERYDDHQWRRLAVKPGLTGLAQVSGRNSLMWEERIRFDIEYVETQSPLTDLKLSVKTVTTIITGHGVEGHPTDDPLSTGEVEVVELTEVVELASDAQVVDLTLIESELVREAVGQAGDDTEGLNVIDLHAMEDGRAATPVVQQPRDRVDATHSAS